MTGKHYQWHRAWSRLSNGRLKHISGLEFEVTHGDGYTDVVLEQSTMDEFQRHERARGVPGNPVPTKTRRGGVKLFAADGPKTWDVGVRMGAALRAAYQAAQTQVDGDGTSPRGHVRRAHWHGFRSGPRLRGDGSEIPADQRKFDLRWLPPIAVNLPDIDSMPSTIKPVK